MYYEESSTLKNMRNNIGVLSRMKWVNFKCLFGDKHSNQLFFYLAQQNYAKLFLYPIIMGDKVTLGNL